VEKLNQKQNPHLTANYQKKEKKKKKKKMATESRLSQRFQCGIISITDQLNKGDFTSVFVREMATESQQN